MRNTIKTEKDEALKEQAEKIALARKAVLQSSAAALMGRLGGVSGKIGADGKRASKRRPSEVCRAAVNNRWDAERANGKKQILSVASKLKKRSD
jgi:hypothetical protein